MLAERLLLLDLPHLYHHLVQVQVTLLIPVKLYGLLQDIYMT